MRALLTTARHLLITALACVVTTSAMAQTVDLSSGTTVRFEEGRRVLIRKHPDYPQLFGVYLIDSSSDQIDLSRLTPLILEDTATLTMAVNSSRPALVVTLARIQDVPPPGGGEGELRSSLTQHGITWVFDREYETGQFCTGDWWVVGPVTIVGITPRSVSGGRVMNGSVLNPVARNAGSERDMDQGFDSALYGQYSRGNYVPSMNFAVDLSAARPRTIQAPASLLSSISHADAGLRYMMRSMAVLTVLSAAPPDGSFRPAYAGADKSVRYNEAQVSYAALRSLAPVSGTPPIEQVTRWFERPWPDYLTGWLGADIHPSENMPGYGREIGSTVSEGAMMLNLSYSEEQKRDLMIGMIQLGLDLQGIATNGGHLNWTANGGHASGRKFPIALAALALGDPTILTSVRGARFGEDCQTYYTSAGVAEWGIRHCTDPGQDQPGNWLSSYQDCCTANGWDGFVLAARMMGMRPMWGHDALFDYMDRYKTEGCAVYGGGWQCSWVPWLGATWRAYRTRF